MGVGDAGEPLDRLGVGDVGAWAGMDAGLGRLDDRDPVPARVREGGDRGRDHGLPDAGAGAGDDEDAARRRLGRSGLSGLVIHRASEITRATARRWLLQGAGYCTALATARGPAAAG